MGLEKELSQMKLAARQTATLNSQLQKAMQHLATCRRRKCSVCVYTKASFGELAGRNEWVILTFRTMQIVSFYLFLAKNFSRASKRPSICGLGYDPCQVLAIQNCAAKRCRPHRRRRLHLRPSGPISLLCIRILATLMIRALCPNRAVIQDGVGNLPIFHPVPVRLFHPILAFLLSFMTRNNPHRQLEHSLPNTSSSALSGPLLSANWFIACQNVPRLLLTRLNLHVAFRCCLYGKFFFRS